MAGFTTRRSRSCSKRVALERETGSHPPMPGALPDGPIRGKLRPVQRIGWIALVGGLLATGCEDKTPPTWEGEGLLEATVEGTSLRLAWPTAADDALHEYQILVDGEPVGSVGAVVREYVVEDLDDATSYELTVEAVDQSGNHSEPLHRTVTTADETGPHWIAGAALRVQGEPPAAEPAEGEAPAEEAPRGPAVLEWDRAEDSGGVVSYSVRREDSTLATIEEGLRHELGRPLEAGEREQLAIVAVDAAGNESAPLRWRPEGAGPAMAANGATAGDPTAPEPTTNLPAQTPMLQLDPSRAAIADRIRRMGLKRPQLQIDPSQLRPAEP